MRRWLGIAAPVITFVSTALGGYAMLDRGAVRPGILMIAAGLVTAIAMIRRELRKRRTAEVTKPPADGP